MTRQRAAPPKLITLDNALLAVMDTRGPPVRAQKPDRFGAWVENACIASAWNAGQTVRYWREEPLEVDAILDGSWGSWAVEIKTGSILHSDPKGVDEFVRRFPKYRPLVVCDEAGLRVLDRAGLTAQHWREFLVNGPPKPSATQSR